jgi:hypothetical protein
MNEITGAQAEQWIALIVSRAESGRFETKRVSGKMVSKALETICAYANTLGGTLALGVEDAAKARGGERLFGLAENPAAVDELRRKVLTHLLPEVDNLRWTRVACTLRDGSSGHVLLVSVQQSAKVHSIRDDGTWTRLDASNREIRERNCGAVIPARHDQRRIGDGNGAVRIAGYGNLAALRDKSWVHVGRFGRPAVSHWSGQAGRW